MDKLILHCAQHGHVDYLKNLHELNRNQNWSQCKTAKTGDTPLHLAAQENKLENVKYLCESWLPNCVDIGNKDGKTALHEAAQFHSTDVLEYLIMKGADVNALKRADWTPLMLACAKQSENPEQSLKCVKTLIENGAKRLIVNKDGWTSLHLAARTGDINVFKAIWFGDLSELFIKTKNGRTVLHVAALHGHLKLLLYLFSKGVVSTDINRVDNCGNTIFHDSILSGNIELVKLLHNYGADIYALTKLGNNVLHLAAELGLTDIVRYLVFHCDIDINIKSEGRGGFTALHCAYRAKQFCCVEELRNLGADESISDDFGRLAKDYV